MGTEEGERGGQTLASGEVFFRRMEVGVILVKETGKVVGELAGQPIGQNQAHP